MTRSLEQEYERLHPVYVTAAKTFAANPPDPTKTSLSELRLIVDSYNLQARGKVPDVLIEDKILPVTQDDIKKKVEIRIVRPPGSENDILPGVIYLHGGGWVFGNKETFLKTIADLAVRTHTAVIYVEYSKSPEVQYPTALYEIYAVAQWLNKHGNSIHVDQEKLATCGDSAGGNMATSVCLLAKERGFPNLIKTQILLYPTICGSHEQRLGFETIQRFGTTADFGLSLEQAEISLINYCGKVDVQEDILIAPLSATIEDLKGLPPCLLIMADCDLMRSENELYAIKLMQAKVETVAIQMHGTIHGFIQMPLPMDTPQYHKTMSLIAAHLTDLFFI
ncbi:alpha/beta hydrolase fold-domain-containing protein [Circinella umbellata]|nr:alpha/beta hydrolase fold-domain-containing protein [Circinella umbellata]